MLYTHPNRLLVNNASNIVEHAGIAVIYRNEYASGAVGGISPLDAWLQLWVVDDANYERAIDMLSSVLTERGIGADWICAHCQEVNDPSFDFCWNCQGRST